MTTEIDKSTSFEMIHEDYLEFVMSRMSEKSLASFDAIMATGGLGLAGEGGEVADIAKKVLFHGMPFNEELRQKMVLELGDVLFYLTFAAHKICGVTFAQIMTANVEKLTKRYKGGKFSVQEFMQKEQAKCKPPAAIDQEAHDDTEFCRIAVQIDAEINQPNS